MRQEGDVGLAGSGDGRTRNQRFADFLHDGPRRSSAPARARSAVQAYNVARSLNTQLLLTYEMEPQDCLVDLRSLMKTSRRNFGPQPWLAVPERGSLGRTHFHLMVGVGIDAELLAGKWGKGASSIVVLPTLGDLKRFSAYLGKHFDQPRSHRPLRHRYIASRGFKPKWINHGYATREEAEILAQQQAGDKWLTVRRWTSNTDWCAGGFEWGLDTPYLGGHVEDEEIFFRRIGTTPCDQLL